MSESAVQGPEIVRLPSRLFTFLCTALGERRVPFWSEAKCRGCFPFANRANNNRLTNESFAEHTQTSEVLVLLRSCDVKKCMKPVLNADFQ